MKKLLSVFVALTVMTMLFVGAMPVWAAGASVSVTANTTKPTVDSTVTVTVKYSADSTIGSVDATVKYDASVLEYTSASGATASGGSGVVTLSYFETSASPSKTKTITLSFKAKKAGSSTVSLTTSEISDWETYGALGNPSGSVTINPQNPQKSGNANLSELYISSGTLSPKFSASVTSYSIVIPNSVTVLTVSAETEDKDATIAVEGSKNMKVGKNVRKVIVTAPDGTTKTYTLNITRQEAGSDTETPPKGEDKTPEKDEDEKDEKEAAKVTIGDQTAYIQKDLKDVQLPVGYEQVKITVNDTEFPSVQDKSRGIVLLYLVDAEGKNGAFYVYDTVTMTFSEFCSMTVQAGVYAFLTPDGSVMIPDGFTQTFVQIGEKTVTAWTFADEAMKDYYLVYVLSPTGVKGLYQYDTVEGTFQRYTQTAAVVQPVVEEQPEQTPDDEQAVGAMAKIKTTFNDLVTRFGMTQLILMGVGVVVLLAAIIVLIVLLAKRPKNCKH